MAFNYYNPYPQPVPDQLSQLRAPYQPMYQPVQAQPSNSGLLWVQGEAGAKSYLVAPNTTVLLMDSEAQRFYLKSTDGAGMPAMKTFEYKELVAAPKAEPTYTEPPVSRSEFLELKNAVARLEAQQAIRVTPDVVENGGEDNE